jgi:hypothetical protein
MYSEAHPASVLTWCWRRSAAHDVNRHSGAGSAVSARDYPPRVPTSAQLVQSAARLRRLRDDAAWALLRGNNAHAVLALLRTHFVDSGESRVPAPLLFERVADDLEDLRRSGFDLPQSAQQYCAEWLHAGWLERRPGSGPEGETYELSSEALTALRLVGELEHPPQAATESRLTTVIDRLDRLTVETDPDVTSRIDALVRERERLDAAIDAARTGRSEVLDERTALERIRDVLALADQLPSDFSRVRREIERLNIRFRKDIIENDAGRGDVLEALFRGVDLLAEQEAGRSFKAFYAVLMDPERSAALDAAIETLLDRDFAASLTTGEQEFLLRLVPSLVQRGGEVQEVYSSLSRGLRSFVQHREYVEERAVHRLLTSAQRRFGELSADVPLHRDTGFELDLSSAALHSVSRWGLAVPDDELPPPLQDVEVEEIDLEAVRALVRESEIDLRELRVAIDATLQDRPVASIGDVIERFPPTQGFGSVVGLVYLAAERLVAGGAVDPDDGTETVAWDRDRGRGAVVPRLLFVRDSSGSSAA